MHEKFQEFLKDLLNRDEQKVRAFAEKNFADKLVAGFENIEKSGLKLEMGPGLIDDVIKPDQTNYGQLRGNLVADIEGDYIIENLLVQGVSSIRADNATNYDYLIQKS